MLSSLFIWRLRCVTFQVSFPLHLFSIDAILDGISLHVHRWLIDEYHVWRTGCNGQHSHPIYSLGSRTDENKESASSVTYCTRDLSNVQLGCPLNGVAGPLGEPPKLFRIHLWVHVPYHLLSPQSPHQLYLILCSTQMQDGSLMKTGALQKETDICGLRKKTPLQKYILIFYFIFME